MDEDKFLAIVKSSPAYLEDFDSILDLIIKEIYCEEAPLGRVGFKDKGGQTSYYSSNVTEADSKLIDDFC